MTARLTRLAVVLLALALAACNATAPSPSNRPSLATPSANSAQIPFPEGRILYMREGSDGVEHYFTIGTDGTNEQALFTAEGCDCAQWSADGSRVLTLSDTGHGTFSFTTMKPDGSDRVVLDNPMRTLNLAPGASTADGRRIAFAGWDETEPSNNGLYIGSPDLTDLHLGLPLQAGWLAVEPFGISPDGSKVVLFAETGPDGGTTHAGHIFVVNTDGTGLRQLNPPGTKTGSIGGMVGSLSPDGRQAAFAIDDAVWVVDLSGGGARRITNQTGFAWSASWSPTGEWITFTRFHGSTTAIALVRPDRSDQKEISVVDEADEATLSKWSPDGRYLLVARDSDSTEGGKRDLWIMDLEGDYVGQVTHEPSNYVIYSWAPASGG
jgi:Tol biopolymer transport system component